MSKKPDSKLTVSHHEATPEPSPGAGSESRNSQRRKSEKERPGAAIINSDDPSTEALRRWALDKQLQFPGQDGSFAQGANTAGVVDGMAWGGPWLLPHKGDTQPPPDEKAVHGEPKVIGAGSFDEKDIKKDEGKSGGEKKKASSFTKFFGHKKEKDREAKGNDEDGDTVR
ncbi:MAG: hypothetical protein ALECFALPRED_001497 [Alectoria fallacina]|uniref:Uncharacterized protein n=1 Tax=Alectoria fallacina TaxID=1903189 RepID=A0A8H3IIT4_9LECA|nr:MAG: hypothetical protein ALECFALPRED_001497 [Alectoria fallacina]